MRTSRSTPVFRETPARIVVAVIVTYDRAILLHGCLGCLRSQRRAPDAIIVVDDASPGTSTSATIAAFPGVGHVRHTVNRGSAAAYCTGIEAALTAGADLVWLMDDDACPADEGCLERLIDLAEAGTGIAAPLVLDHQDHERLAFPVRLAGRTRFLVKEVEATAHIENFAHLFNGALVRSETFAAIGLPDPRFICRGDEVEFLLRARRGGIKVRIDTAARFLHPSSQAEIHPILFGLFYATVPLAEAKRGLQFRNRGYIFRAYGLWHYLTADIVRYGCHYLLRSRPDAWGMWRWFTATARGWKGDFMHVPTPQRPRSFVTPLPAIGKAPPSPRPMPPVPNAAQGRARQRRLQGLGSA